MQAQFLLISTRLDAQYMYYKELQDGKSLPKWELRAKVGVYLGNLWEHALNISHVLNPKTGHISAQ